ncbi:MAG: hypothetical protein HYV09_02420 [Deltaproteobacteria bacterium]|nr:hypothetical protein [Deltaproteobacteria bacterium]
MRTSSSIALFTVLGFTSCAPRDDAGGRQNATVLAADCYSVTQIDNRKFGGGVAPPHDIDERGRLLFDRFIWDHGERTPLRAPEGWVAAGAVDFNERGDVVGTVLRELGAGARRPIVWWHDGTVALLPEVASLNEVLEITERGHVLARTYDGRAWDVVLYRDGAWIDLGRGIAYDVNDDDEVVLVDDRRAVLWKDGARIDLGLDGALTMKLNDHGQVIANAERAGPGTEAAFLWETGVARMLPALPSLGDAQQWSATAINERGDVAGLVIPSSTSTYFSYAVLWRGGAPTVLADWSAGVLDLNDAGQVFGNARRGDVLRPFVWDRGTYVELPMPFVARSATGYADGRKSINERGDVFFNMKPVDGISHTLLWRNDLCGRPEPEPEEPGE